jgi:hypothetical protein
MKVASLPLKIHISRGFVRFYSESADSQRALELSKLYLCPSVFGKGVGYLLMKQRVLS